ncbi:MAG: hypothetical protein WCP03_01010 [Candidatus Saccharibacteria bacterium]
MNKQPKKTEIENTVMTKIKKQEVKMKPHYYYTLLSVVGIGFVILASLVVAYSRSVVTLWLRIQDAPGPAYGAKRNLSSIISGFPWWALIMCVILLIVSIVVIRKVGILYKIRPTYLITLILAIVVLLGFVFSYTSLPNTFHSRNQKNAVCSVDDANCPTHGNGNMRGRQLK